MEEDKIIVDVIFKEEPQGCNYSNNIVPGTFQQSYDVCQKIEPFSEVQQSSHQMDFTITNTKFENSNSEDPDSPKYVCGYCGLMFCLQEDYLHHLHVQHGCDMHQMKLELKNETKDRILATSTVSTDHTCSENDQHGCDMQQMKLELKDETKDGILATSTISTDHTCSENDQHGCDVQKMKLELNQKTVNSSNADATFVKNGQSFTSVPENIF
eukprot:GHVU01061400.1.p1 GENE.GHVU01061400.1~~GHVU01061400.1.p1  ORF type:complete len:213 (-),score=28.51 GHVU01061400.1:61-699(-)